MTNPNWRVVNDPSIPWMRRLNDLVSAAQLPALTGRTLYVTSDFSGVHKKSKYEVISMLIADWDRCRAWEEARSIVRRQFLPDGRRMSFKDLNDRCRLRALIPFLESADEIEGICVSVASRKGSEFRYIDRGFAALLASNPGPLQAKWPYKTLDTMFRVVHLVGTFIAGFCKPRQNIYWICDQDAIFASEERSQDVARLLSAFTSMYVAHELGELGVGTTRLDEGDRLEEDFCSIPDLAAGALSEVLTALCEKCGGRIVGGLVYPAPQSLKSKTDLIFSWLMDNSRQLKKLVLLFEPSANHLVGLTRLEAD